MRRHEVAAERVSGDIQNAVEQAAKGFGAHSDQERLLEEELHRFVRFSWDAVVNLARAR